MYLNSRKSRLVEEIFSLFVFVCLFRYVYSRRWKIKVYENSLLITTHYLYLITLWLFLHSKTCLNRPRKTGERWGRGNEAGDVTTALLKAVQKWGHEMLASYGICRPRGGGVFPYMGCIGMCVPGYGFSAVFIRNRVSILAILVSNRVRYLHSILELDVFFRRSLSLSIRPSIKTLLNAFNISVYLYNTFSSSLRLLMLKMVFQLADKYRL